MPRLLHSRQEGAHDIEIHQGAERRPGPLHRHHCGLGVHWRCGWTDGAQPIEHLGGNYPVCNLSYTSLTVVEIEEADMIITALIIFVIAAAGVTWYVTTH